jgi:hypothetical protein
MAGRRTAAVLLPAAVLVAACTAEHEAAPRAAASTTTICGSHQALTSRVRAFVEAYDRGERGLADRFFARAPVFQWYSERGLRQGAAAYDRSTLDAYLTGRERQGDRQDLLDVTSSDSGRDFTFTARRAGEEFLSKGAVDCGSGLFVVWSLGPDPGP